MPGLRGFFEYLQENHRSHEVVSKNPITQSLAQTAEASSQKARILATFMFCLHSFYLQRLSNGNDEWGSFLSLIAKL
jgi:hypothetical protein